MHKSASISAEMHSQSKIGACSTEVAVRHDVRQRVLRMIAELQCFRKSHVLRFLPLSLSGDSACLLPRLVVGSGTLLIISG